MQVEAASLSMPQTELDNLTSPKLSASSPAGSMATRPHSINPMLARSKASFQHVQSASSPRAGMISAGR